MKDIARVTGLGLATISKYLNGGNVRPKNKVLIDSAVKELGFTINMIARSLKTSQSHTIGVVIPELNQTFSTTIITHVTDVLRNKGYAVLVCDCRTNEKLEKEMIGFLLDKRVDGILNMPTSPNGEHLQPALDRDVPVVLIDRMIPRLAGQVSAVVVDNVDAAHKATTILLDAGHRNIGIILGPRGIYTSEHRCSGIEKAYAERGLTAKAENIVFSDYSMKGGYEAAKKLLSTSELPSALFVTNYDMTLGTIIALNEMQIRVPEDLSFVGFDKLDAFGEIFRTLTLMKQPQNVIGERAAHLLLNMLGKDKAPILHQVITLSAQLELGTSVLAI